MIQRTNRELCEAQGGGTTCRVQFDNSRPLRRMTTDRHGQPAEYRDRSGHRLYCVTVAQAPLIEAEPSGVSLDGRPSVLTIGYLVLDVVSGDGAAQVRSAGGTSGNVAANLAWLGVDVGVVGRIGNDVASEFVVGDLRSQGVGIRYLHRDPSVETPVLIHRYDQRGAPQYLKTCPTCGRRFAPYRPPTVEQAAEAFYTTPSVMFADRASLATITAMEAMRDRGGVVFFEPNGPGRPHLTKKAVELANILKISEERRPSLDQILFEIPDQIRIVTMGSRGLRYREARGGWNQLDAFPVRSLVDSGGAGDWVSAGLIKNIVDNRQNDIRQGLRFGQALAALSCSYPGARGLNRAMTADSAMRLLGGSGDLADGKLNDADSRLDTIHSTASCSSCI